MNVFEVRFNLVWDNQREAAEVLDSSCHDSAVVSATDVEAAIKKTREMNVGVQIEKVDEYGNNIEGQFQHVTDIVVQSVEFVRHLDG